MRWASHKQLRLDASWARRQARYKWHRWWAWHTVTIDGVAVLFETIERRRKDSWVTPWEYRDPQPYPWQDVS
jgi:hypothetical protein